MTDEDKDAMKAQLDEWSTRLAALQANAANADGLAKIELFRAADSLQRAQRAAMRHFDQIVTAPPEALDDATYLQELLNGWNRVSAAVTSAWKRFELR